jgi:hypothetical protein
MVGELFTNIGRGTYFKLSKPVLITNNLNDLDLNKIKSLLENSFEKKLKDDYPKMRNMVWVIESASPGILSNLKEFTELDNLSEINKFIRRGSQSNQAPNDQKVDDLVEKCGSISVRTSEIQKFPTLLDYIILLSSR